MKLQAILFDTDNTFIFFNETEFFSHYFPQINSYFSDIMEAEVFQKRMLSATKALLNNNGEMTNLNYFTSIFTRGHENHKEQLMERFEKFYEEAFHRFKDLTVPFTGARALIDQLQTYDIKLVSASNPLWPEHVQEMRLEWAGIGSDDFDLVTHVGNMSYCKPQPDYYREISEMIGIPQEACLMVGNDPLNDMIAKKAGMKTYLTTDWKDHDASALYMSEKIRNEHTENLPEPDFTGSLGALEETVKSLL